MHEDARLIQWEASYERKDNFVFYPNEEVIRFVSKHFRKRVGLYEFVDRCQGAGILRALDLGCGIGRHVVFLFEMGFEAYGIDLSHVAVDIARSWASDRGVPQPETRIIQGDARTLPWPMGFFDCIVSHGVLDSMPFEIAKAVISEAGRVLKPGGLLYMDLVSGDDHAHAREYAGEDIVETNHEKGTIQSYFNFSKIQQLLKDSPFEILECFLIKKQEVLSGNSNSRYHLALRSKQASAF